MEPDDRLMRQLKENAQQSGIEEGERMNIVDEGEAYLRLLKGLGYRTGAAGATTKVQDMGIRKLAKQLI